MIRNEKTNTYRIKEDNKDFGWVIVELATTSHSYQKLRAAACMQLPDALFGHRSCTLKHIILSVLVLFVNNTSLPLQDTKLTESAMRKTPSSAAHQPINLAIALPVGH